MLMRQHKSHSSNTTNAPEPVRSWRLLLLVLLVLLPITVALAAPEPTHALGESPAESGFHGHSPTDTPICHHGGDHRAVAGAVADKRDLDAPTSGENASALPVYRPEPDASPYVASAAPEAFSRHTNTTPPLYLLTQRFRV